MSSLKAVSLVLVGQCRVKLYVVRMQSYSISTDRKATLQLIMNT